MGPKDPIGGGPRGIPTFQIEQGQLVLHPAVLTSYKTSCLRVANVDISNPVRAHCVCGEDKVETKRKTNSLGWSMHRKPNKVTATQSPQPQSNSRLLKSAWK